ncbi:MAG: hypothetical protein ACYTFW_13470 [Planctomycetota bacterium]
MRPNRRDRLFSKNSSALLLSLMMAAVVCGQYKIDWYTIDGGGGTSSGGQYTLTGTIGQPDAGWSIGGIYELLGGFWLGGSLPECYTGPHYDQWLDVGSPACWCADVNPRQCHGDADGQSQGKKKYWVSTEDLDILIAAWNKPFEQLAGNQICGDFDHLPQGKKKYRVSPDDLDILIANWNKTNAPAADCP